MASKESTLDKAARRKGRKHRLLSGLGIDVSTKLEINYINVLYILLLTITANVYFLERQPQG